MTVSSNCESRGCASRTRTKDSAFGGQGRLGDVSGSTSSRCQCSCCVRTSLCQSISGKTSNTGNRSCGCWSIKTDVKELPSIHARGGLTGQEPVTNSSNRGNTARRGESSGSGYDGVGVDSCGRCIRKDGSNCVSSG